MVDPPEGLKVGGLEITNRKGHAAIVTAMGKLIPPPYECIRHQVFHRYALQIAVSPANGDDCPLASPATSDVP